MGFGKALGRVLRAAPGVIVGAAGGAVTGGLPGAIAGGVRAVAGEIDPGVAAQPDAWRRLIDTAVEIASSSSPAPEPRSSALLRVEGAILAMAPDLFRGDDFEADDADELAADVLDLAITVAKCRGLIKRGVA